MRMNWTGRSRLLHADWSNLSALYTGKRSVWIRTALHILQIGIRRRCVVSFTRWSLCLRTNSSHWRGVCLGPRADLHVFEWKQIACPCRDSTSERKQGGGGRGRGTGDGGIIPLFFNVSTTRRWSERSNSLPSPLYPSERILRTHYREGWVDSRVSVNGTGEVKIPGFCQNSNPESSRP